MKYFTTPLVLLVFSMIPAMGQVRTWTNQGGVELEAELVGQDQGMVKIRRVSDRQVFAIPIETLSEADRDWLKKQAGSAGENGIYIAAGHGGHRMSSVDGINWFNHEFWGKPAHNQEDLKAIAAGNGACVVVGGFSRSNILTTTDGIGWHKNEFNMGVLSGVIFHEGKFHALGESGKVATSADGMEWSLIGDAKLRDHLNSEADRLGLENPIKSNIRRWREVDGLFVGAGDNCIIVSTRDFENWTFAERLEPQSRLFIEADKSGFVVRGDRTLHHSTDGVTWNGVTPELPDERTRFNSLVHDGERFIVNTRGDLAFESPDGIEWKEVKGESFPGTIEALRPDLYYSFETYWKYTEDLKRSTDGGKTWESTKLPAPVGVTCIVFAEGFPQF